MRGSPCSASQEHMLATVPTIPEEAKRQGSTPLAGSPGQSGSNPVLLSTQLGSSSAAVKLPILPPVPTAPGRPLGFPRQVLW